jgi:hypothetical protein
VAGLVWHLATPPETENPPAAASRNLDVTLGSNTIGLALAGGF